MHGSRRSSHFQYRRPRRRHHQSGRKASPGAIKCYDPDSSVRAGPRRPALHPGRQAAASYPRWASPIASLQQATRTIPIVFMNIADPVGAGLVQSMPHPGGNITGFSNFEYSIGGKWAELLKQIAPQVTRALVLRDPTAAAGIGLFAAIRSVAQSLDIEL